MNEKSERVNHLRKESKTSPLESLVAGSISGAVARAVTAPLDTIKIRFQLSSMRDDGASGMDLVQRLLRNEGIYALWKGNVPAEALYILYGASQFTSYTILNKTFFDFQLRYQYSLSQPMHSLFVGSCTGLISTIITYPFDLLRTRLAASESRNLLPLTAVCKSIHAKYGSSGFFVGMVPSLLSVTASSGLFFGSYALARDAVEKFNNTSSKRISGVEAICGFFAGIVSKAITFPLDTIRKRMQVTSNKKALKMIVDHYNAYGFSNFYRGFGVSLLKTAPTNAISVAVYEYALSSIRALSSTI